MSAAYAASNAGQANSSAESIKGHVVVVGAGPAGIFSAIYLARRGFKVDVYEKRGAPNPEADGNRSYAMVLNQRTIRAMQQLHFDLSEQYTFPFKGATAHFGPGRNMFLSSDKMKTYMRLGRAELAALCHQEANRQFPDRITFHFQHELQDVDFDANAATFTPVSGQGEPKHTPYDLLIGADGGRSNVRKAMERKVPGFTCTIEEADRVYKSFFKVKAEPGFPIDDVASATESEVHAHNFRNPRAAANEEATALSGFWVFNNRGGTCSGIVSIAEEKAQLFNTEADHEELIKACPVVPASFRDQVVPQVAASGWSRYGPRVVCSQLHGPRTVLLGDAAHSISPRTGEGCNSASEDATVLDRVLERCGGDLAAVPAAYTAARLPDVHTLAFLDKSVPMMMGFHGKWNWLHFSFMSHYMLAGLRHKLLPALFDPPCFTGAPMRKAVPYSEVPKRQRRDAYAMICLVGAVVAVGAKLVTASVMAAAARISR